jgi:hypothetical protein
MQDKNVNTIFMLYLRIWSFPLQVVYKHLSKQYVFQ